MTTGHESPHGEAEPPPAVPDIRKVKAVFKEVEELTFGGSAQPERTLREIIGETPRLRAGPNDTNVWDYLELMVPDPTMVRYGFNGDPANIASVIWWAKWAGFAALSFKLSDVVVVSAPLHRLEGETAAKAKARMLRRMNAVALAFGVVCSGELKFDWTEALNTKASMIDAGLTVRIKAEGGQ